MKRFDSQSAPRFFWQGILILLPILVLAVFGFAAILRDRSAVEEEARQRADEILRQANAGLAQNVAMRLTGRNWVFTGSTGLPFADEIRILLDEKGQLLLPRPYENPPKPPDWLNSLSNSQREVWTKLTQSVYLSPASAQTRILLDQFLQSDPPTDARANAQFILPRWQLLTANPSDSLDELLQFSEQFSEVRSEAGLPLSSLAFANAMDFAHDETAAEKIISHLARHISEHPSVIAPQLLEKVGRLLSTNIFSREAMTRFQKSLGQTRDDWEKHVRLREMAEALPPDIQTRATVTTNFWIQSQQAKFFCLVQPGFKMSAPDGKGIPSELLGTSVLFFPMDDVRRAFAEDISERRLSLPEYFALTLEVENEPLPLKINSATNFSAPVLAQVTDQMILPATASGVMTLRGNARNIFSLNPGVQNKIKPGVGFAEARVILRLHLADRKLLFARQRQRSLLFAALIAFAVIAALVGFVQARRAFYRQLRLNEMKSNFVSSVSHELRAPIASVRLLAESLERGKISEPQKQKEYFKFITQECRRLSSLIENVLDFSRIDQGRKEYEFEPTDIVKLIQETGKLMQPYAAEKQVNLVVEVNDPQLSTPNFQPTLDGRAIQQALVNLIDNAIKHSPAGAVVTLGLKSGAARPASPPNFKEVSISARIGGTPVLLYVEDCGPGIPLHEREKIFERFYRLGSELRRETQGVGIGLSIVKHIVDAHGGKVFVQSEVEKGSRFTIELPMDHHQGTKARR
ncbi:MAG: HAMP domain-containing sensor histidine kinase [Verrucomicrobiota bacterium]